MTFLQDTLAFAQLFPNAVICGTVMAAVCGALGVFVVLRRIVFISVALSEAATCGLALSLVFRMAPLAGSALMVTAAMLWLALPGRLRHLPREVALGTVFLLASSMSILLVAQNGFGLEEVKAMLYGDLIVSGAHDLRILLLTGIPSLATLLLFLRPILYVSLDREGAQVMGIRCWFWEALFFFLLGLAVSGASRSGGALLVFCLLVVTPATALLLTRRIWQSILLSMALGVVTTWLGLGFAYRADWPANPTVIGLACLILCVVSLVASGYKYLRRWYPSNARV